jgi:putative acetyltransferase
MTLTIRPERLEDIPAIHAVNTLAFGRTAEAELVERIRGSSGFVPELSLVAERAGKIVGHALFSRVPILTSTASNDVPKKVSKDEAANAQGKMDVVEILALAPLAVRPGFQRKGVGSELIRAGVERGNALGYRAVGLIGNPMYYSRFGFVPGSTFNLKCSYGVPDPVFMVLPLRPDGLAGIEGTFTYPVWFEGV